MSREIEIAVEEMREQGLEPEARAALEDLREKFRELAQRCEPGPLKGAFERTVAAFDEDLIDGFEAMDTELRSYMARHGGVEHEGRPRHR